MRGWTNIETSMRPSGGAPVPARADQLTAQWLTDCLRHCGVLVTPARVARVSSRRVGQGHGFAGQLARVELDYEPADAPAPRTLIAKFASEHAPTRELLALVAGYAREVRFYRELAPQLGDSVPRCYFAHYDRAAGEFLLLLQDMAPAQTADIERGLSVEQAELLLDRLAAMHARFWRRIDHLDWLDVTPELLAAMRERLVRALPGFVARFAAEYPRTARAARHLAVLLDGDDVWTRIKRSPRTLAHNDVHVNNLLLPGADGGRFALIDWQSVTLARHGTSDVARVLGACIAPELRRAHGGRLIAHYHARLQAHGVHELRRSTLLFRLREETAAMVLVGVLAFDALDFAGEQGERTAAVMGERIEAALADGRIVPILALMSALIRCRRWLRRVFGRRMAARS